MNYKAEKYFLCLLTLNGLLSFEKLELSSRVEHSCQVQEGCLYSLFMFDQREWSSTTEECKVIIVGWNCVLWWMVLQYHWYVEVKLGCFSVIYKGKYRSVNTALLNKLPLASFSLLEPQWCVKTTALTSAGWKIYRLASLFSWSSSPCSHTMATMANSFPLDKKIPSV